MKLFSALAVLPLLALKSSCDRAFDKNFLRPRKINLQLSLFLIDITLVMSPHYRDIKNMQQPSCGLSTVDFEKS